jgi:hypothetical protein
MIGTLRSESIGDEPPGFRQFGRILIRGDAKQKDEVEPLSREYDLMGAADEGPICWNVALCKHLAGNVASEVIDIEKFVHQLVIERAGTGANVEHALVFKSEAIDRSFQSLAKEEVVERVLLRVARSVVRSNPVEVQRNPRVLFHWSSPCLLRI